MLVGLVACSGAGPGAGATPRTLAPIPGVRPNPFGIQLDNQTIPVETRVAVARSLGASYLRPAAVLTTSAPGTCEECPAIAAAGLRNVLTVANRTRVTAPATFPPDLADYQNAVGQAIAAYRPALLVVENEENAPKFYAGTPQQYGAQLRAACEVSHRMDVPCTDGGLQSPSVAVLTYQHYVDTGQADAAASYARRTFGPQAIADLHTPAGAAAIRAQAVRLRAFLDAVTASGADYVNLHWYLQDAQALGETIDYMEEATGLPAVCNEMGQLNEDPDVPVRLLRTAVDRGLPFIVWFSIDGIHARALNEPDGSLRPNGMAIRAFVADRYGP
jgi:hypothetical protein